MTIAEPQPRSSRSTRDPARFTRAYEEHHDALYRYCRSLLRNEHDASDALSSAVTKAFAAWQRGAEVDELRPWLFRIAHNESITLLRRRRTVQPVETPPELPSESLELTVERRERLGQLERDLAALPEQQHAALVLRELNGLGHEEIASVLDSTPRAVKQTIYEARVALLDAEAGREMSCAGIQKLISDGDGRVLRGRRVRGHLRSCVGCRRFAAALERRPADLALLAPPLAPVAATLLLANAVGATGTAAAGGLAAGSAAGVSSGAFTMLGAGITGKGAAAVAVAVTAVGGGVVVEQHRSEPRQPPARTAPAAEARPAPVPAVAIPAGPQGVPAATAASPATLSAGAPAVRSGGARRAAEKKRSERRARQRNPNAAQPATAAARASTPPGQAKRTTTTKARPVKPANANPSAAKPANVKPPTSRKPAAPPGQARKVETQKQQPQATAPGQVRPEKQTGKPSGTTG